jgi:hypothetical protein
MVGEGRSVGLDVPARSIVAGVLEVETGQLWSRRLPPATEVVLSWIRSLPGLVVVAYAAGPTGFGLARALSSAGVRWVVVAPRSWSAQLGIGSRPTGATLSGWLGCCTSGSCLAWGCRPWPRRRRGIWSGLGRTPARI